MLKLFRKHSIKIHKVLIIGIIVFCCAIIVTLSSFAYLFSERSYRQTIRETVNDPYVIKHELERNYETDVEAIFDKYKSTKREDKVALEQLKNELLELTVPDKYRQQHFKMVVTLDELTSTGKSNNVTKQVDWLKVNTAWLGNLLSQFIINNW